MKTRKADSIKTHSDTTKKKIAKNQNNSDSWSDGDGNGNNSEVCVCVKINSHNVAAICHFIGFASYSSFHSNSYVDLCFTNAIEQFFHDEFVVVPGHTRSYSMSLVRRFSI